MPTEFISILLQFILVLFILVVSAYITTTHVLLSLQGIPRKENWRRVRHFRSFLATSGLESDKRCIVKDSHLRFTFFKDTIEAWDLKKTNQNVIFTRKNHPKSSKNSKILQIWRILTHVAEMTRGPSQKFQNYSHYGYQSIPYEKTNRLSSTKSS